MWRVVFLYWACSIQCWPVICLLSSFHRVAFSVELDTRHPLLINVLKGAPRVHASAGTQQRVRRPVSWAVLKRGDLSGTELGGRGACAVFGVGGFVSFPGP